MISSKSRSPAIQIIPASQQFTERGSQGTLTTNDMRDALLRAKLVSGGQFLTGSRNASHMVASCTPRGRFDKSSRH